MGGTHCDTRWLQMDIGDCRILPRGTRCLCQECCRRVVLRASEDRRPGGAVVPCRLRADYTPFTSVVRQVANLGPGKQSVVLGRKPRRDELDTLVDSINRFRAERSKAEEALLNALQTAHLAYWEFDSVSREFTLNDQYYSLHGISAADAVGYHMQMDDFCR